MARPQQSTRRTVLAGLIGNVMEWFDFAVYGYFASVIGGQFFPQSDPGTQLLLTFAVFGVGFLGRPIGSLVLGAVGDRIGRRALLVLSIALMGGATLLIGLLPTYASIGVAAPILLVTLRLLQGFSVGGEFTGSMVYTTEFAPSARRGLVSSSTAVGTTIGFILGSGQRLVDQRTLTPEQVAAWGWRVPFIGSVLFLVVGVLLRRGLQETEEGLQAAAAPAGADPVAHRGLASHAADLRHPRDDQCCLLPDVHVRGRPARKGYGGRAFPVRERPDSVCGVVRETVRRVVVRSRRPSPADADSDPRDACPHRAGPAAHAHGHTGQFAIGQILMAVPTGMALGMQGAMLVEIFPLRTRVTSMSFAYSVTLALAGGTAPLVSAWLVQRLGQPLSPAWYIMGYGVVGLTLLWSMKETNSRALNV